MNRPTMRDLLVARLCAPDVTTEITAALLAPRDVLDVPRTELVTPGLKARAVAKVVADLIVGLVDQAMTDHQTRYTAATETTAVAASARDIAAGLRVQADHSGTGAAAIELRRAARRTELWALALESEAS